MSRLTAAALAVVALALAAAAPRVAAQGTTCLACGLLLALGEQLANTTSPPTGPNPDVTCAGLGLCDGTCPLFPGSSWPASSPVLPTDGGVIDQRRVLRSAPMPAPAHRHRPTADPASVAWIRDRAAVTSFLRDLDTRVQQYEAASGRVDFFRMWRLISHALIAGAPPCDGGLNITCDISRVFDQHLPLADGDNDYAAASPGEFLSNGFRGGDWRGRDCNDSDPAVYPGRRTTTYSPEVDHNCNGIAGVEPSSGQPYETLWCSGANAPMSIAILGDSAAAHFHLPPELVNARTLNLSGVLELASNEADWPQCSWSTGYRNTSACPDSFGVPMASMYQRLLSQNACGHRAFLHAGTVDARV